MTEQKEYRSTRSTDKTIDFDTKQEVNNREITFVVCSFVYHSLSITYLFAQAVVRLSSFLLLLVKSRGTNNWKLNFKYV